MAQNITELAFKMKTDVQPFLHGMGEVTSAVAKIAAGVTNSQDKLGAWRDQFTLLRNSTGQVVEGLSNWQIAMGMSVDAIGNVINRNGELVTGLTTLEQKMGYYVNANKEVVNSLGEYIRDSDELISIKRDQSIATEQAAKAAEKEAETIKKLEEAHRKEAEAIEKSNIEKQMKAQEQATQKVNDIVKDLAQNVNMAANMFITFTAGSGEAAKSMKAVSAAVGMFTSVATIIPKVQQWYKALTVATKGQTVAQTALNVVSGNWVTMAVGAAAAIGTYAMVSSMEETASAAETTTHQIENLTDAIRHLSDVEIDLSHIKWDENLTLGKLIKELQNLKQELSFNDVVVNIDGLTKQSEELKKEDERLSQMRENLLKIWNETERFKSRIKIWSSPFDKLKEEYDTAFAEQEKNLEDYNKNFFQSGKAIADEINSIINRQKSETDRIEETINSLTLLKSKGYGKDNPHIQEAIDILTQQYYEPLKNYRTNVEKTTDTFAWMDKITDENIIGSEAYQRALKERAESLDKATLQDSMSAEQFKVYESIQNYQSAMENYTKQLTFLNELKNKEGINQQGLLDAMEKNKQSLLSSSKFGSYLEKARESLIPFSEKLTTGFNEIDQLATTLKYTQEEVDKAKDDFRKALDAEKGNKSLPKEKPQASHTDLAASERGSLEAYKVLNNNQDKTVKAIDKQTREYARIQHEETDRLIAANAESGNINNIPVFDGGSIP
jgi:hypothetical protein